MTRRPLLCITPNPAVDRTLVIPGFAAGRVWRAESTLVSCGGKGMNVARVLRALGMKALCAAILGGATGRLAAEAARAEGLAGAWTWIAGETRTDIIIVDENAEATVVNEPGPAVTAEEWERFTAELATLAREAAAVSVSGSFPPATPPGTAARLIAAAAAGGAPVWIDTSGPALAEALAARPAGVKINATEAAALLGHSAIGLEGASRAARALLAQGAASAVITLGAGGAVMAEGERLWHATPPALRILNPTGSGDAFLGGLLKGLATGLPPIERLREAVAAGSAAALRAGTGDMEEQDFHRLLPAIRLAALS